MYIYLNNHIELYNVHILNKIYTCGSIKSTKLLIKIDLCNQVSFNNLVSMYKHEFCYIFQNINIL